MFEILANRTFRHLFLAQVIALMGTGLATVALGLLAFDLVGGNAALVLGLVFTIKMVAYVLIAPVAGAVADRVNRRKLLVWLDLVRATVALMLPFVSEVWQIFGLILVLHAASAVFTPTFQATLPDVLPEEEDYTRALSLSRLANDLENIASPTVAALLLLVLPYAALFAVTGAAFIVASVLILMVSLPPVTAARRRAVYEGTTRGLRIYLATPRLPGLMGLNLAVASCGAMVLVNSVVLVRGELGLSESALAWTIFAFGTGSMVAAIALPRMLAHWADRPVMTAGAAIMTCALLVFACGVVLLGLSWPWLLGCWAAVGLGNSAVLTPAGRLLRRSSHPEDRPALFAAQFALSHACWLVTYPLSGWAMTVFGAVPTSVLLAALSLLGLGLALARWPADDPVSRFHTHDDLPPDHPHLKGQRGHAHPFVIDDLHRHWK